MIACVKNLNLSFSKNGGFNQILHNVTFSIKKNEFLAIVGESGSGKSVTSKTLMGLLPKGSTRLEGDILSFKGTSLLKQSDKDWQALRGNKISMIFQEPMSSLNPTLSCGDQVIEILKLHKNYTQATAQKEVVSLFQKVKIPAPEKTLKKYPHEISGGQMQRVMIAMAIACQPELLIADEPTTALDATVQKEIILLLKSIQQEYGMSVLFISHDLSLVHKIADRILVMYKGRIVEEGSADKIFNHPDHEYTAALIASRPSTTKRLERLPTVTDYLEGTVNTSEINLKERKERLKSIYALEPIVKASNLIMDFPLKKKLFQNQEFFRAVNNVSLNIYPKESLGLVGESGCGKSTLGNMLVGLKKPTRGEVYFQKKNIHLLGTHELRRLRNKIQIIFQDPFSSLNPRISIGTAIQEPMKVHGIGANSKERKAKVLELLKKVGLSQDHYDRYPHEFSGGQRQRIGIARTIALEPEFIVCDESVSALDISVQAQVLNLLNDLKEDYGFSYLFISHDLAVVKYFCDRVIVMNKGEIEEVQEADALFHDPKTEYTKKLLAATQ